MQGHFGWLSRAGHASCAGRGDKARVRRNRECPQWSSGHWVHWLITQFDRASQSRKAVLASRPGRSSQPARGQSSSESPKSCGATSSTGSRWVISLLTRVLPSMSIDNDVLLALQFGSICKSFGSVQWNRMLFRHCSWAAVCRSFGSASLNQTL